MSLPLRAWISTLGSIQKIAKNDIVQMRTQTFMRDPFRANYIDPRFFYSPADGIILYQKILKPKEKLVEIKGINYSLQDIMDNPEFDKPCLVIGIFMTYYDVHINRVPYGGYFKFKLLTPTTSYNRPMIFAEKDIVANDLSKLYQDMNYLKTNARMLNTFYNPNLDYTYYVTQIADDEVNVITHFTTMQNTWMGQNERFSLIRWGSQCELILPIDKRYKLDLVVPDNHHVEGCIDKLVQITKK